MTRFKVCSFHQGGTSPHADSPSRRAILAAVAGLAAMAPSPGDAVDYVWDSGNFSSQNIPSPLIAPHTLAIQSSALKTFDTSFINQANVSWLGGDINLSGGTGTVVLNSGLFDILSDNALRSTSPQPRLENENVLRKSGGSGTTTISVTFDNRGTLEVQSGIIDYASGNLTFSAGTRFLGTGVNRVSSNASFSGHFDSTNLLLAGGTFSGTGASMGGAARWTGGVVRGNWMVEDGATLTISQGTGKIFDTATFMNGGSVAWNADNLGFQSNTTVTNAGLWAAGSDNSLSGSLSTFQNRGTFLKSGSPGVTTIGAGVRLVNSGVLEAQSGTIDYASGDLAFDAGSSFQGTGINQVSSNATFSGAFTSSNLVLTRGTFTGVGASAGGQTAWSGGTLTGEWQIPNGATFRATGVGVKPVSAATLTNSGAFLWEAGNMNLQSVAITNAGLWEARGNNILMASGPNPSTFANQGVFRKRVGSGVTIIANGVGFTNTGVIEVHSGLLHLPQAWTNDGTVEIGRDAVFQVSGATFTNRGTIRGSGTVRVPPAGLVNQGRLGRGALPSRLRIEGNLSQSGTGAIDIGLGRLSFFDVLEVTGTAALDGILNVHRLASYGPQVGDTFVVLTATGGIRSTFDAVSFFDFPGVRFDVRYGPNDVQLEVTVVPEAEIWLMLMAGLAMVGYVRLRCRSGD